jgi:hypothetical protein
MIHKPLGDLLNRSKSLAEYATNVRTGREKLFDFVVDQAWDKALPEELPDDLKNVIRDEGKFFLVWLEASILASPAGHTIRTSVAARKLSELSRRVPTIQKLLKSLAENGLFEPIRRLVLVADANKIELESSALRIVDSALTPYQAKTQCRWVGTLAEFRTGSIVMGPADPRGHFAIYVPSQRVELRGSFLVTRITCEFQNHPH